MHAILKVVLWTMFNKSGTPAALSDAHKAIAKKILTGRAGFDASTYAGTDDEKAKAHQRSVTSLIVMLTSIATTAH